MCKHHFNPNNSHTLNAFSPLPIPKQKSVAKQQTSRYKFWEIPERFHCSALGTCLTLKELRQIARKAQIGGVDECDDYELHVAFISVMDKKRHVSTLVNKLLDSKYKRDIQRFSKTKCERDRQQLWHQAIKTGEIAGAFWALLTHPNTSEQTLFYAYGKVHMLSHLSGASVRTDMKEFHALKKQNETLETQLKKEASKAHKQRHQRDQKIDELQKQLTRAQEENKQLISAKKELDKLSKEPMLEKLQNHCHKLTQELEYTKTALSNTEEKHKKWQQKALDLEIKETTLQQELQQLSRRSKPSSLLSNHAIDQETPGCEQCINTNPDLCGRCVLYVGGRGSQYAHFRQLVEQQNGQFIHHDGGREDGHQKLASIVSKADAVLCPLDCVSHTAMNAVKRHCKNTTKKLVFIPHASLSAFARGLGEIVD